MPHCEGLLNCEIPKVHVLQSIVAGIMTEDIFKCYFVGLSEEQHKQFMAGKAYMTAVSKYRSSPFLYACETVRG